VTVDEIFARPAHDDLSRHANLRIFFEADWTRALVAIVKNDRDARLGYSRLAALVDEVLEVLRSDGGHVGDTQYETYRVKDVGLSGSVESCHRIEALIPAGDDSPLAVGLEAVKVSYQPCSRGQL